MGIPESEDDASTDMTGITTSFANHICCYDFRVEADSKGGLMIDGMKGGEMVTSGCSSVKFPPHC